MNDIDKKVKQYIDRAIKIDEIKTINNVDGTFDAQRKAIIEIAKMIQLEEHNKQEVVEVK